MVLVGLKWKGLVLIGKQVVSIGESMVLVGKQMVSNGANGLKW
jgi:hypothetical protein